MPLAYRFLAEIHETAHQNIERLTTEIFCTENNMLFTLINIDTWKRKEHFAHYMQAVPCTYSVTVNIDITLLKNATRASELKIYPILLYLLTKTVNRHETFRTSLNDDGKVGIWDALHPSYTIFNKDTELFCNIWTPFDANIHTFYQQCVTDMELHIQSVSLFPQMDTPPNTFPVSSLPWLSFSGFNLNLTPSTPYLLPIFTFGKFMKQHNSMVMPLSIQVHHAVCDGFHIAKFLADLQEAANSLPFSGA